MTLYFPHRHIVTTKLALFVLFNTILPFTDVGTDALTFFDLIDNEHIYWASLNMYFMWNSFVLHLLAFIYKAILACTTETNSFEWIEELKKVVLHIPFVMPLKNLYNAYLLYRMGFGLKKDFKEKNWKRVEEIQHEAGICTMYESFMEGGPQSIVQLVIVLSTGRISYAQWVSIPMSIISLAWSSSRVYFILRTPDDSDPDPEFMMVLLRIFPWELMIVINSVLLWTMIGGLLGGFVFHGLLLSFLILLGSLYLVENINRKGKNKTTKAATQLVSGPEEQDYKLTSALTSLWLPCVVGEAKSNFFLTSAIVSIVNKILLLVLSVLLAYYTDIDTNVFLLWCRDKSILQQRSQTSIKHCQLPQTDENYPSCWNPYDEGIHQLVRVCGPPETERRLRIILLSLVAISSLLAILASIRLHRISDYFRFHAMTKTFLCFPTRPVVHRSTVFILAADKEQHEKLGKLLEISGMTDPEDPSHLPMAKQLRAVANRPRRGETPLHVSTKAGNLKGTEILLRAGAIPTENYENTFPDVGVHLTNAEVLMKLQESKREGLVQNFVLIALKRQLKELPNQEAQASTDPSQLDDLLKLVGEGDHIAKQDVTLWDYPDQGEVKAVHIKRYEFVEVRAHLTVQIMFDIWILVGAGFLTLCNVKNNHI